MTYENLTMYGYAAPFYDPDENEQQWDESLDANNPDNFNDGEEYQEEEDEKVKTL